MTFFTNIPRYKRKKVGKPKNEYRCAILQGKLSAAWHMCINVKPLVSKNKSKAAHTPMSDRQKGHNKGTPYTTYTHHSEGSYFFGFLV